MIIRPRPWRKLAVATSIGLLLTTACGCFGPNRTLPEPIVVAPEPEPPPQPATPPPAVAAAAAKPAPKADPEEQEASRPVPKPPKPKRPADVAQWTPEDLLNARQENDPSLQRAVQQVIRVGEKAEETLWLLTRLMELPDPSLQPARAPSEDDDDPRPTPTAAIRPGQSLAALVIPYFASIEHDVAGQVLPGIIKGELKTDLIENQAVELVLSSMLKSSPTGEELMKSVITSPSRWRAENAEGVTAEGLHELGVKVVQPIASPALRTWLAEYIVQSDTPAAHRERLGAWLAGPDTANLGAQIVLHNSTLLSSEAKNSFRDSFARLHTPALDQVLGVTAAAPAKGSFQPFQFAPAPTPAPASAPKPSTLFANSPQSGGTAEPTAAAEDDPALATLRQFWSTEFLAAVAQDVSNMNDIGANRELMLLASNLPHTSVRRETLKAMQRRWLDGPAPFETAKITLDSIRDPGFLLLVKSMPREQPKPTPGAAAAAPKPPREQQAKFAWMNAAEGFMRTLNARFNTASRGRRPGAEDVFPITLHKGLPIVAEYHLQWPKAIAERMKGSEVDPLVIHYARLEGDEKFERVSNQFRSQLGSLSPAGRNVDRGQWLDGMKPDPATGRLRSVDVLITRDGPAPRNPNTIENLVVEVLWIEIADPTAKAASVTAQGKID